MHTVSDKSLKSHLCRFLFATVIVGLVFFTVAADCVVTAGETADSDLKPMRLLVPAYFYPAGEGLECWNRLIASHDPRQNIEIVAIANINSGKVGSAVDPNYADVIRRAAKQGLTVIAYITSDYANAHGISPLQDAKENVTNWFKLYPELRGVFIDEQSSDAAPIASYYLPLRTQIAAIKADALVVGNPGNNCVEDYLAKRPGGPIMDVVIIHENNETKLPYRDALPATWMSDYSPNRFAMLVHTSQTFAAQLRLAKKRRTAYVFVTDAIGPPPETIHPWGKLPSYWADELQMVGALNDQRPQR